MSLWQAEGFWMRDNIHWPRPVLPLFVSYGLKPIEVGSERAYEDWSIPSKKNAYLVLHGYIFQRTEALGGEPPKIMERFPFLFHLWRIDPKLRKRIKGFERFLSDKGFEGYVHAWKDEWAIEAQHRLEPIKNFDRTNASLSDLADHLDQCYDYMCWSWNPHVKIVMISMMIRERWVELCKELLNLTEFEAYELVQKSDSTVFNTTNRLLSMARRAALDPAISRILSLPSDEALVGLTDTWFKQELEKFLDDEGDRPVDSFEMDPTWREMPEMVVGIIKGFMASDYDPSDEDADFQAYRKERILDISRKLTGKNREDFDYWLQLAEQGFPLTESHDYSLANIPLCHTRYDAIEAGSRFVEKQVLDSDEDMLYLYREELSALLRGTGDLSGLRGLVAERKAEHTRNFTLVPPQTIGNIPMEPPWNVFPPAVSDALKILLKQASGIEAEHKISEGVSMDGELYGTPGSAGIAEGTVRIIHTASEFDLVMAGEILVCPFTTPTWTVLFPRVAGLVTDSGGALSHAAIVAREYGLPSVVGTINGTKLLQNGQRIRVNGATGMIKILSEA